MIPAMVKEISPRMRKAMKPLLIVPVLLVVLYAVRGPVGRSMLLAYLAHHTGLVVQSGDVDVGRGISVLRLEDVVFRKQDSLEPVLRLSEVEAEVGFLGLARRPVRLNSLHVVVDYLNLERDRRGRTQLASAGKTKPSPRSENVAAAAVPSKDGGDKDAPEVQFYLKALHIEVHEVKYRDFSMGGDTPMEMALSLNIQRDYNDVTSTDDLAKRIEAEINSARAFAEHAYFGKETTEESNKEEP